METYEVQFQPDGIRVSVAAGTFISDALHQAGILIQLPCGGAGRCGKCAVEVHPAPDPTPFDRRHIPDADIARGIRLACRTKVAASMRVLIPSELRIPDGKILTDGTDREYEVDPCMTKTFVQLQSPSLDDQTSDLSRLKRGLGMADEPCAAFDLHLAETLPELLRTTGFKATAVRHLGRIIAVEPGDTTARLFGIAFDIGTTTVVGTVMALSTGRELAHASRLNAQVVYGEDTISRIRHATGSRQGALNLRERICTVMNEIIAEASSLAGIGTHELYEAVVAGNTTMSHLFLGLDTAGLSQIPFTPVVTEPVNIRGAEAGIDINPGGNVHVLPSIAGFVGSDTVAVMLDCGFLDEGEARLAVDVGTNGELALRNGGSLSVCSTAAGPALEGATLACGMRAASGAIEHIRLTAHDIEYDVIGDTAPLGLCGSGIIDLAAVLLDAGIIDETGLMLSGGSLPQDLPEALRNRVEVFDGQPSFLVHRHEKREVRDVVLTQRDIRQIQLAKGAIRAGIDLLLLNEVLSADDLHEILLAGAFGNYITKESAIRIGLLPDIDPDRIRFVGNAASTGAKMALLSRRARTEADHIRKVARHVELAAHPSFTDTFMNTMLFPGRQA
jgi:uncharacterized 2Fe-2S/4Fe-4S cluster protein (DUF4445 family)